MTEHRAPRFRGPVPTARFGAGGVVWPDGAPVVVDLATLLVLQHLDGSVPVDELVEDAADALGARPEAVGPRVRSQLLELERSGTVVRVDEDGSATGTEDGGATEVLDLVERPGERVVVERLADGRIRRTTTITVGSTSSRQQLQDVLMTMALTDVLTDDSCLGAKLRVGAAMTDLVLDLPDRRTRVRVDDPASLDALRERFGPTISSEAVLARADEVIGDDDSLQRDLGGPGADPRAGVGVTAYVVAPLDGVGPVRVYDRGGNRCGRPRTPAQVVDIVAALIAEELDPPPVEGVVVHAAIARRGRSAVLMPSGARDLRSLHQQLARAGWSLSGARRLVLDRAGTVWVQAEWPSDRPEALRLAGAVAVDDDPAADPRAGLARSLLEDIVAVSPVAAQVALDTLAVALAGVSVRSVDGGDPDQVRRLADVVVSVGG